MKKRDNKKKAADALQTAIEEQRGKKGFLPEYSNFYFEKKQRGKNAWIIGLAYLVLIFSIWACAEKFQKVSVNIMVLCCVGGIIYFGWIQKKRFNKKKVSGIYFNSNAAVRTDSRGRQMEIPYSLIEHVIVNGELCYDDTGLKIGYGCRQLCFHYEIGYAKAQKHIKECYDILQSHLSVKLPPFGKNCMGLFDRKYFYEKSRKNHTLSLAAAILVSFLMMVSDEVMTVKGAWCLGLICGIWESYSLYQLFKGALFSAKNHDALKEMYGKYPNAKYGYRNTGYIWFAVDVVLVLLFNLWMICMIL